MKTLVLAISSTPSSRNQKRGIHIRANGSHGSLGEDENQSPMKWSQKGPRFQREKPYTTEEGKPRALFLGSDDDNMVDERGDGDEDEQWINR